MDRVIFCENCQGRIAFSETDKLIQCRHCYRGYRVTSGVIEQLSLSGKRGNEGLIYRIIYSGSRQLLEFRVNEKLGLSVASQISIIWRGKRLVGIADQQRQLWLPVDQRQTQARSVYLAEAAAVIAAFGFLLALVLKTIAYPPAIGVGLVVILIIYLLSQRRVEVEDDPQVLTIIDDLADEADPFADPPSNDN